jgi:ferredoxin--NADP+ reductase
MGVTQDSRELSDVVSCLPLDEVRQLRRYHYNAVVESVVDCHAALRILRMRADQPGMRYIPGQFTLLGLGAWEPCASRGQPGVDSHPRRLLERAYSFSSPILNRQGELVEAGTESIHEFYLALVPASQAHPPGLTPRLFLLKPQDRLFLGMKPKGHYTTVGVGAADAVIFVATGVGEAPHNSMLADLLRRGHMGTIVSLVCTRYRRDQAYEPIHRQLERRFPNYRYLALTTREVENVDPSHPQYIGKQYLREVFSSGRIEEILGGRLDPAHTHVFLCGNSTMIGVPHPDVQGRRIYPTSKGLIEVLEAMGFRADEPQRRGNIHFEQFW